MYKSSKFNQFFPNNDYILLFNGLSRACVKIDHAEFAKIKEILLKKIECNGEDSPLQDILKQNGFIIRDDINEIDTLEYLYNSNYFRTDEINIVLVPTFQCNCKCPYCFEGEHKEIITEDTDYFNVLRKFSETNFLSKKRVHISLFGGEPLLRKDDLFSFLDFLTNQAKEFHYELSTNIVTNGVLLDETTINRLLQYNCISIQVTLDGNKKTHNTLRCLRNGGETFDIIIHNFLGALNYCINNGFKTQFILRINLFNQSESDIKSIFELFNENVRRRISIIFRPIYVTSQFKDLNSNSIFELKKFYDLAYTNDFGIVKSTYFYQHCESDGGLNFFYITPDLKIWKCINDLSEKKANIGFIEKTGYVHTYPEYVSHWYQKSNPFKDEECRNCDMLPLCYGGCNLHFIKTGKRKCNSRDMAIIPYFYP